MKLPIIYFQNSSNLIAICNQIEIILNRKKAWNSIKFLLNLKSESTKNKL